MAAETDFVDITKIRSVIVTYHSVRKKTIKRWFSTEEISEEVKTNAAKVIFTNGVIARKENIKYASDGIYRTTYVFQNGLETLRETINPLGSVSERIETSYYPNGKKSSEIQYKDGKRDSSYYYKYDSYNNLIELQSHYSWSSRSSEPTKYSWTYSTQNGLRIETEVNLSDHTKNVFFYDALNRLVKKLEYDENGALKRSFESFFDANGLEYACRLDGTYNERMKYDEHNNLVWMEWFPHYRDYFQNASTKYNKSITILEYVYDYRGNWIELRQFRDGAYNLLQTRKIEYVD